MESAIEKRLDVLEKNLSKVMDTSKVQASRQDANGMQWQELDARLTVIKQVIKALIENHPAPASLRDALINALSAVPSLIALEKMKHPFHEQNPYSSVWQQAAQDEVQQWVQQASTLPPA